MYPCHSLMVSFCFGGGRWFLGRRTERTDWSFPFAGGGARPWWRGGGRGGGQTVRCTVSWAFSATSTTRLCPFTVVLCRWYVCVSCSLSLPQIHPPPLLQYQPHPTPAVLLNLVLLPLTAWSTNSRTFLWGLTTQWASNFTYLSCPLPILVLHCRCAGGNHFLCVLCPGSDEEQQSQPSWSVRHQTKTGMYHRSVTEIVNVLLWSVEFNPSCHSGLVSAAATSSNTEVSISSLRLFRSQQEDMTGLELRQLLSLFELY